MVQDLRVSQEPPGQHRPEQKCEKPKKKPIHFPSVFPLFHGRAHHPGLDLAVGGC